MTTKTNTTTGKPTTDPLAGVAVSAMLGKLLGLTEEEVGKIDRDFKRFTTANGATEKLFRDAFASLVEANGEKMAVASVGVALNHFIHHVTSTVEPAFAEKLIQGMMVMGDVDGEIIS